MLKIPDDQQKKNPKNKSATVPVEIGSLTSLFARDIKAGGILFHFSELYRQPAIGAPTQES